MMAAAPGPEGEGPLRPVRLWDAPTRLFHWALVMLVVAAWITQELDLLERHMQVGQAILTLVLFRVLWGLFGSTTARFTQFVKGPRAVLAYAAGFLKPAPSRSIGHNAMGALSVLAILGLLLFQAGTGLFGIDTDGFNAGPLNQLVSYETGRLLVKVHGFGFDLLTVLVVIHVAVIAWYGLRKRENLVRPMVTGRALWPDSAARTAEGAGLAFVGPPRALLLFALSAGLVWALFQYGPRIKF